MAELQGSHYVAGAAEPGAGEVFHGFDPVKGEDLQPGYAEASAEQVQRACEGAASAAAPFAASEPSVRAALLRGIGEGLKQLGDELVHRVQAETALPAARVEGERARTVMQLNQFADLVEAGSWVDARIDHAEPARQPMPKPDLRRMYVPLGPVVVVHLFAYRRVHGSCSDMRWSQCRHPSRVTVLASTLSLGTARTGTILGKGEHQEVRRHQRLPRRQVRRTGPGHQRPARAAAASAGIAAARDAPRQAPAELPASRVPVSRIR